MARAVNPAETQDRNSSEDAYLIKTLDLYEISNDAVRLLSSDFNAVPGSRSGRENDSDVATVLQLEESIVKWETSLPQDLKLESYPDNQRFGAENVIYRQAVMLRLR